MKQFEASSDAKTARNLKKNSYMYLSVIFSLIYLDIFINYIKKSLKS